MSVGEQLERLRFPDWPDFARQDWELERLRATVKPRAANDCSIMQPRLIAGLSES
jgi:hypothetical protein